MKKVVVLLSIPFLTAAEVIRRVPAKQFKKCIAGEPDLFIKLGRRNATIDRCKLKCINDENCVALQYVAPKACSLYYSPIDKMEDADEDTWCGRLKERVVEDPVTTPSPTSSPTYAKHYIMSPYTKCDEPTDWEKTRKFFYSSLEECQMKCSSIKNCKSFQWNGKTGACKIFRYRIALDSVKQVPAEGPARVCAIVPKIIEDPVSVTKAPTKNPTKAPTKSPTKAPTKATTNAPTKNPTKAPTKNPTKAPTKAPITSSPTKSPTASVSTPETCVLRAVLKFDFGDNPDNAPYYGYHADYMEVIEAGNFDNVCSHYTIENPPSWCTYENSNPEGDSAYVSNVDDNYDDGYEALDTETIFISGAAGKSYEVYVSHWFFGKDYYADWEGWQDHMLAATLKIKNMSHATQKQLNSDGWSHPTDLAVSTHIKDANGKWIKNPDYKGYFKVNVSCDSQCLCSGVYELRYN